MILIRLLITLINLLRRPYRMVLSLLLPVWMILFLICLFVVNFGLRTWDLKRYGKLNIDKDLPSLEKKVNLKLMKKEPKTNLIQYLYNKYFTSTSKPQLQIKKILNSSLLQKIKIIYHFLRTTMTMVTSLT